MPSLLETPLARLADKIAEEAHKGQKRKWSDDPYIVHPRRVAATVATLEGITEIDVAAALLHDVVEDTPVNEVKLKELLEAGGTDPSTADAVVFRVMELTKPYGSEVGMTRAEKRKLDWAKLATVSPTAKRMKLVDRIDNLANGYMPPGMIRKYIPESRDLLALIGNADEALAEELKVVIDGFQARLDAPRES